jgi:hypothetical protein
MMARGFLGTVLWALTIHSAHAECITCNKQLGGSCGTITVSICPCVTCANSTDKRICISGLSCSFGEWCTEEPADSTTTLAYACNSSCTVTAKPAHGRTWGTITICLDVEVEKIPV